MRRLGVVRAVLDASAQGGGAVADLAALPASDRAVDAGFLRRVLLGDLGGGAPGGFMLRGAHVVGGLNLSEAELSQGIHFDGCTLAEPLRLSGANCGVVSLNRCELAGIDAAGLRSQSVIVTDCEIRRPVYLTNARVAGAVAFAGTNVHPKAR